MENSCTLLKYINYGTHLWTFLLIFSAFIIVLYHVFGFSTIPQCLLFGSAVFLFINATSFSVLNIIKFFVVRKTNTFCPKCGEFLEVEVGFHCPNCGKLKFEKSRNEES